MGKGWKTAARTPMVFTGVGHPEGSGQTKIVSPPVEGDRFRRLRLSGDVYGSYTFRGGNWHRDRAEDQLT